MNAILKYILILLKIYIIIGEWKVLYLKNILFLYITKLRIKKNFLKDYIYTYIYNKSGKTNFIHEHIIYISDYFIKKLRVSLHWYIDCTFIVPPSFKQMLVILYRDENSGKRYPAFFCLTNNKKFEGYNLIFKRIKEIITVDHTKDLNILSYSIDFEKGL